MANFYFVNLHFFLEEAGGGGGSLTKHRVLWTPTFADRGGISPPSFTTLVYLHKWRFTYAGEGEARPLTAQWSPAAGGKEDGEACWRTSACLRGTTPGGIASLRTARNPAGLRAIAASSRPVLFPCMWLLYLLQDVRLAVYSLINCVSLSSGKIILPLLAPFFYGDLFELNRLNHALLIVWLWVVLRLLLQRFNAIITLLGPINWSQSLQNVNFLLVGQIFCMSFMK